MNVATQRGSGDDQMVLYSNEIDIVNVQRQVLFTDVADLTISVDEWQAGRSPHRIWQRRSWS